MSLSRRSPPYTRRGLGIFWRQPHGPAEGGQRLLRGIADLVPGRACQDIVVEALVVGIGDCVDRLINAPNGLGLPLGDRGAEGFSELAQFVIVIVQQLARDTPGERTRIWSAAPAASACSA